MPTWELNSNTTYTESLSIENASPTVRDGDMNTVIGIQDIRVLQADPATDVRGECSDLGFANLA